MASHNISVLFIFVAVYHMCAATVSLSYQKDGITLQDLEPNKYFSYGVLPKVLGQNMTISFYDVEASTRDCDHFSVEVQNSGYFKNDFNRITTLCYPESIDGFTAWSTRGFFVIIRTGNQPVTGKISVRFTSPSGYDVTGQLLFHLKANSR